MSFGLQELTAPHQRAFEVPQPVLTKCNSDPVSEKSSISLASPSCGSLLQTPKHESPAMSGSKVQQLMESELLGVSVAYLESSFLAEVRKVFGACSNPNFHEINAAMLHGAGPREVKLVIQICGGWPPGSQVTQRQGAASGRMTTEVVALKYQSLRFLCCKGSSRAIEITLIETKGKFVLGEPVEIAEEFAGMPSQLHRRELSDIGHPMGKGLICPRDGKIDSSYVDALKARGPDGVVAPATVFLSWCWSYTVNLIVSALGKWCNDTNHDKAAVFVWICALNNNQFRVADKLASGEYEPFEKFCAVFRSRIQSIGSVIALLDSWEQPLYTSRLWCDLELCFAVTTNTNLSIIIPPDQAESFQNALPTMITPERLNRLWSALMSIRIEDATATSPEDAQNIKRMLTAKVGFEHLNHIVQSCLQDWFVDLAMQDATANIAEGTDNQSMNLKIMCQIGAAHLLEKFGCDRGAKRLLREALEIRKYQFGESSVGPVEYAAVLKKTGLLCQNAEEALKVYQWCASLETSIPMESMEHAETARLIGKAYFELGQCDEALASFQIQQRITLQGCGRESLEYSRAVSNIGSVYHKQSKLDEAFFHMKTAWDIRVSLQCQDTPEGAVLQQNLGIILSSQEKQEEAIGALRKAEGILKLTLGMKSDQYLILLELLAEKLMLHDEKEEAFSVWRAHEKLCESKFSSRKLGERIKLVKGIDRERPAWYYVHVTESIAEFWRATNDKIIHLEDHGSIMFSGFGEIPPEHVTKQVQELIRLKDADSHDQLLL